MSSIRNLSADKEPLQSFKDNLPLHTDQSAASLPLHLFEWNQHSQHGTEHDSVRTVEELEDLSIPDVRVLFAPRDIPTPEHGNGLAMLFEKCAIPSAFIAESLQHVSQSFSNRTDENGTTWLWFHFLCKDLAMSQDSGRRRIVHGLPGEDDRQANGNERAPTNQSQANFTWIKPGIVLKIESLEGPSPKQNGAMTSNSDTTLNDIHNASRVTMFCFGAPITVGNRFRKLKNIATCDDILHDPYVLLEVVFEEMYKLMDRTGWLVSDIFGEIETTTLGITTTPGKAGEVLNGEHFTGLHNLAKHTIYLRENCESALATLDSLRKHHQLVSGDTPNHWQKYTQQALDYRKSLFQSTQRRLSSLDKRMTNIIQLSFNLVTQADSRTMQSENQSMKTIAVMTLIFMPLGTVASVFGTQLIRLKDDAPYHMEVSRDFWLLWIISVPLTGMVMIIWKVWYRDAKTRLGVNQSNKAHGYMGWKSVKERFRGSQKGAKTEEYTP